MKRSLLFLVIGLLTQSASASPGTMIKDEDLRSTPSGTSSKVASISKGSTVDVLARQGGWTQIRAGSRTGWVRILSVRSTVSTSSAGDLAALTSKRDGSQVVAVAGLRGLNEEELKAAKFDAQALMQLDRYKADQAEASSFARAANLVSRKLSYLPESKAEPSTTNSSQGWGFVQ
jgi:uncharacterized protein YgiM (DUF1202 family)